MSVVPAGKDVPADRDVPTDQDTGSSRTTKRVALLVETSRTYGRDLLRGINRYLAEHDQWSVFLELRALDSQVPRWLASWRGDGIISRTGSPAMADAIAATGLPGVELRASRLTPGLPFIGVDNRDLGRIVADHFIDNGFTNFAVFDLDTERYFEERRDDFRASLAARGHACHELHRRTRGERPSDWERHQADVVDWLASLPKPIGVFACTDQLAFWLLDACRRAGVAVPEEVAVVGAENDETLCTMSQPQLSSVAFAGERIGYEAAALLDQLMAGRQPDARELLVPPRGLVVRQSSDITAIDDPQVAAAVRFVREHACRGINVADVATHAGLSRTLLERRMRQALGRTPGEEIIRVRFGRVRALLSETDLPLAAIAERCGFVHPQYMAEAFKKLHGVTPGGYRASRKS